MKKKSQSLSRLPDYGFTQFSDWNYPTRICFGAGRIHSLADFCKELSISKPLLVTDRTLASHAIIKDSVAANNAAAVPTDIFCDVKSNPVAENIEAGVKQFRRGGHDGVIAFGGGSALDAAKAIAFMSAQSASLWEFEDIGDNWKKAQVENMAPLVAVPTTAGTGSEVGRAAVIVDQLSHTKKIIFHPKMLPALVIADPQLTLALPASMTASTGMDALSHNLEAYCAPGYHPMADAIAVQGIRLIVENLVYAVQNGDDLCARSNMLVASMMGATAFQKGLGAMHALAHPIGAIYDAHHGLLNAILMPYVLKANQAQIEAKIHYISCCLQFDDDRFDAFIEYIVQLREKIGIPHDLRAIGIKAHDAPRLAEMAIKDPSAAGNPIQFTSSQYQQLLDNALEGRVCALDL